MTFNVLARSQAEGRRREAVIDAGLAEALPDVVALQEVTRSAEIDQVLDWFGPEAHVVDHPNRGDDGVGACLVSRHPIEEQHVLDLSASFGATGLPWLGAVAAAVVAPSPIGRFLVVHHKPSWQLDGERVREAQAVAVASFIDRVLAGRDDLPVVLLGDFDAGPEAASIQFLTGRRSLQGVSVRFEDAWEATQPSEAGHTFTPVNPLVRAGQMPLERGRRIDHIMVRSGPHGPLLDVSGCRLLFDAPVDGIWASDHFAVLADLVPPPHPPGGWAPGAAS
jgi:endonuclease/exonuclease/phosphatase family metal-dependent hydrolase